MTLKGKTSKSNLRSLVMGLLILFVPWLNPSFVKAADVVLYYHNDALGSPVAMTNSGGTVIWNVDYGPFGDEVNLNESPNLPNSHRFVGKETDVETGLHNLGTRYYDPGIGRFLSLDPALLHGHPGSALNIPFGLNLYSYSFDNPYRYRDSNGQWPTFANPVHQKSINEVLPNLPLHDIWILTRQQVIADKDQTSKGANKHAMRAPNQTVNEAWIAANNYVVNELVSARLYHEFILSGNESYHDEALMHVGNAIHTVQDSTSPEHEGLQEWDDTKSVINWLKDVVHVVGEVWPESYDKIDAATRRVWEIYKSGAIPSEVLPRP